MDYLKYKPKKLQNDQRSLVMRCKLPRGMSYHGNIANTCTILQWFAEISDNLQSSNLMLG